MTIQELTAKTASIKNAVSSASTCSSATVNELTSLLEDPCKTTCLLENKEPAKRPPKQLDRPSRSTKAPTLRSKKKPDITVVEIHEDGGEPLQPIQKLRLATEVVNATLRSLTEAIKTSKCQKVHSPPKFSNQQSSPERPNFLLPLQSRCVNQTVKASEKKARPQSSSAGKNGRSCGVVALAECARVALGALRRLNAQKSSGVQVPSLQTETGMSVLIGKLILLGFDDMATKELRILAKRLSVREEVDGNSSRSALSGSYELSSTHRLSDLLQFDSDSASGERLNLIVTTQLLTLKLLACQRRPSSIEAAYEHLQISASNSPVNLLLRLAAETSSGAKEKAAKQLEVTAQSILSLCPSLSLADDEVAADARRSVSPCLAFKFQVLALQIRMKWWRLSSHKADLNQELATPLAKFLRTFSRRSTLSHLETYQIAGEAHQSFSHVLDQALDTKSHSSIQTTVCGNFDLHQALASLAQDASIPDVAVHWISQSIVIGTIHGISQCRISEMHCQITNIKLKRLLDGNLGDPPWECLKKTTEALQGDLSGESADLDDLLISVAKLRKLTFLAVNRHFDALQSNSISIGSDDVFHCLDFVYATFIFLTRYIGNEPDVGTNNKLVSRYNQRRTLARKVLRSGLDSLTMLAKDTITNNDRIWAKVDKALQACVVLVSKIDYIEEKDVSDETRNGYASSILLSHAYWCRYLRSKEKSSCSTNSLKCLRNSVEILEHCSVREKIIGLLPAKLERLGTLHEATDKSSKSLQMYAESLKLQTKAGSFLNATIKAALVPLHQVFEQDMHMGAFNRSLANFLRAVNEVDEDQEYSRSFFDDVSLPPDQRGLIVEQQLYILENMLEKRLSIKNAQYVMSKISSTLLELYVVEKYPIRRLRTAVSFLRLHSNHPSAIPENLHSRILEECTLEVFEALGADIALGRFKPHLLASRDAYITLTMALSGPSRLQDIVRVWASITKQCETIEALQDKVYDIPVWLNQLGSIAGFLDMQGHGTQRVEVLDLVATIQEMEITRNPSTLVSSLSSLGRQLLRLGNSEKAGISLHKARQYVNTTKTPAYILVEWHLCYCEYFLEIGDTTACEEHLSSASMVHSEATEVVSSGSRSLSERRRVNWMKARLAEVQSLLSSTQGHFAQAMLFARDSVKLIYRAWAMLEHQCNRELRPNQDDSFTGEGETPSDATASTSVSESKNPPVLSNKLENLKSTPFWHLTPELFRRLSDLSQLFAHEGSISEAQYYVEQASKIANAVNSQIFRAQMITLTGKYNLRRGKLDDGLRQLQQVKALIAGKTHSHMDVVVQALLAEVYGSRAQWDAEEFALRQAEEVLQMLQSVPSKDSQMTKEKADCSLPMQLQGLSLKEVVSNQIQITKNRVPVGKRAVKKVATQAASENELKANEVTENPILLKYHGSLLRQQAEGALHQKRPNLAASYLARAAILPTTVEESVLQNLMQARLYLYQGLDKISNDPVFCILHESTISFPSTAPNIRRKSKEAVEPIKESRGRSVQSRKTPVKQAAKSRSRKDGIQQHEISEYLGQALDTLMKAQTSAQAVASSSVIHALSDIFGKVLMMLNAACFNAMKTNVNPFVAAYAMELGRSLSTEKESVLIQVEKMQCSGGDSKSSLSFSNVDDFNSTLTGTTISLQSFQSDYLDIIPSTWTVISMSLSENLNELQFSKLRAGQTPFILSIPLNRHNSRDADEDVFTFSQGKSELVEIIDLANYSTHDTIDMSRRGAKTEWWEARSALDSRLKDLLENIENIWLGGFRGIFCQDQPRPNLLSRFQTSFYNILERHLPSRQKGSKAAKVGRVTLDQRVLELFIGLGNPGEVEDLEEPLMDLLYFVVDILQFHGERNAYDEIDFDSITIETLDVLRHYHEAAMGDSSDITSSHTILILDKALHCFPWESLPCMAGQAISRLPSLVCLRKRILQMQEQQSGHTSVSSPEYLHIDSQNTTYILNPSADLSSTQATFSPALSSLPTTPCATPNIIARDPTEAEMSSILSTRSLFLYFGHGSGGQYIRTRTIKKLDQCAIALLMGCSSGKLEEEGKYEPHGMIYNYLHAGSPAVVGTLWDVTDKDIDRWGMECLTRWGLFDDVSEEDIDDAFGGVRGKVKSKARAKSKVRERIDLDKERGSNRKPRGRGKVSLDQAVALGREKCFLRYLNGAAPVVYGIPVGLSPA